jgi:hypothetical protein
MTTAPVTAKAGRSQPRLERPRPARARAWSDEPGPPRLPGPPRCAAARRRGGVIKEARTATVELSMPAKAARDPPRAATAARALVNLSSSRIPISRARSTHSVSINDACRSSHGARVR